jgi:hypothetical protein
MMGEGRVMLIQMQVVKYLKEEEGMKSSAELPLAFA